MAHKGKPYPVAQNLRQFNVTETWPFYVPVQCRMTIFLWTGSYLPKPFVGVPHLLSVRGFTLGDVRYEYRSANIGAGSDVVEIGFEGRCLPLTRYSSVIPQCWLNNVPQMIFGTASEMKHVPWLDWGPAFFCDNQAPGFQIAPLLLTCSAVRW
jgi:hypothetical protein